MEVDEKPLQQQGYDFMAAAFEVYNELGHGFTEDIYQETLARELTSRRIPFVAQPELMILYKGRPLNKRFRPDMLVFDQIVVELKAVSFLTSDHAAQLLNYLKASGKPVGYLVNFGCPEELEWRRYASTRSRSKTISVN